MKRKRDSIDNKFLSQIKQFQSLESNIPKLKKEFKLKSRELEALNSKDPLELTDEECEIQARLKLELPEIQNELKKIESREVITQYYLDVGGTLSQYYQALSEKDRDLPTFEELIKGQAQGDNSIRQISQAYNARTDPNNYYEFGTGEPDHICEKCGVKREAVASEGLLVCPQCMDAEQLVVHTDKPCYNDSPCDNIYFSYKRINHFKEKLGKIQQKYNFKIPRMIEEKLCEMFLKIQEPFIKFCPAEKNNFTSYSYVINKCLHILKKPQYARHFHLLKSKDKLYQADMIWKKICAELNWPFYPSSC